MPYDPYEEPEHMPLRLVGAGEPGYWGADSVLGHGTDYGYSIDGGPLLPDPRSVWLPQGIHGPTRVFDPAFEWTDGAWSPPDLSTGVLMHVDVETFTPQGTLDAAAELLPTVAELGVHGVELAPVAAFDPALGPSRGVRLYSVHEPYGGPRALQRFINAAHALGLAVVLDIPYRWAVADELGLEAYGPYLTGGSGRPRPPRPDVGDAGEHALQAMRPRTGQVPLDRPRTGPIQLRTGQVPSIGTRAGKVPSAPTVRTDFVGDRINLAAAAAAARATSSSTTPGTGCASTTWTASCSTSTRSWTARPPRSSASWRTTSSGWANSSTAGSACSWTAPAGATG